jgi:hypothetical protein
MLSGIVLSFLSSGQITYFQFKFDFDVGGLTMLVRFISFDLG